MFPTLLPRKKWHHQHRNVAPGDIVLIQYKGKVNSVWKLGKVKDVFPDKHGAVRTCEVEFRPKQKGEKALPYKTKPLSNLRTAVQRICVLLPVEEQPGEALEGGKGDTVAGVEEGGQTETPVTTTCVVPLGVQNEAGDDFLDPDRELSFSEDVPDEGVRRPAKLSRQEIKKRLKETREPRRFSRRLAGFSAAVKVAMDLEFYLSSEDEDVE